MIISRPGALPGRVLLPGEPLPPSISEAAECEEEHPTGPRGTRALPRLGKGGGGLVNAFALGQKELRRGLMKPPQGEKAPFKL